MKSPPAPSPKARLRAGTSSEECILKRGVALLIAVLVAIVFCAVVLVPVGVLVLGILVPRGALELIAAAICAFFLAPS